MTLSSHKIFNIGFTSVLKWLWSFEEGEGSSASLVGDPAGDISRKSPSFSVLVFHGYLFTIPKNKEVVRNVLSEFKL